MTRAKANGMAARTGVHRKELWSASARVRCLVPFKTEFLRSAFHIAKGHSGFRNPEYLHVSLDQHHPPRLQQLTAIFCQNHYFAM